MAQNVELTSEILQVNAISIDPLTLLNPGTKQITALSSNANTVSVLSTKMAATILMNSSGALTMAQSAGGVFVLTVNNTNVASTDQCFANVAYTSGATGGLPVVSTITASANALVIVVQNAAQTNDAARAFSGSLAISYAVFKN